MKSKNLTKDQRIFIVLILGGILAMGLALSFSIVFGGIPGGILSFFLFQILFKSIAPHISRS